MYVCCSVAVLGFGFASCGNSNDELNNCPFAPFFEDRSLLYGETLTILIPQVHHPTVLSIFREARRSLELELRDYNVTVRLEFFDDPTPDLSMFQQLIYMEMMAGTMTDALILLENGASRGDRGIDWRSPSVSRYFADMWPEIRADPDFNEENFVTNIFDAMTFGDGSLRVVPEAIRFEAFRANRLVPGLENAFMAFESVCIDDLHMLHSKYIVDDYRYMFFNYNPRHVASALANEFLCLDNRVASFNSDRFVDVMTHALEMTNLRQNEAMSGTWYRNYGIAVPELAHSAVYAFMRGMPLMQIFELIPLEGHEHLFSTAIPYTNSQGELLITPLNPFAISASSSYAQRVLAWKYIKRLTSIDALNAHPAHSPAIIIYRPRLHKQIYFQVSAWYPRYRTLTNIFSNVSFHITGHSLSLPEDEALEVAMKFYSKVSNMPMVLHYPFQRSIAYAIEYAAESIRYGIVLPSQAAATLQNRVMLILMEGN